MLCSCNSENCKFFENLLILSIGLPLLVDRVRYTCCTRQVSSNDPLGQPTNPAGSDCWFILKFWDGLTDGQTDVRTICVKIVIITDRNCGRRPCGSTIPISFSSSFSLFYCWVTLRNQWWSRNRQAKRTSREIASYGVRPKILLICHPRLS